VREIARRASRQSGLAVDEGLVRLTLRRLERAHLLEGEAPPLPDAGRRELMRRAAALGAFAVASLAAPTPAMAVTCTPCGTCINLRNNQCTGLPCCDGPRAGQGCLSGGGGQFCTCGGAGIRTCT
jgi:hypothetical protein